MDGFAVVAGAGGELEVIGEARAGHPFGGRVSEGSAARISTGALVPEGADAVVPVERTTAVKGGGIGDGVDLDPAMRGKGRHHRPSARERSGGDPIGAAVRTAAGLAATGVKVAGAVTQELVRRLPRRLPRP
jgi:molybdopterin molybdotransferase